MKLLFHLLTISLFFISFKVWSVYTATSIAIATVLIQVMWSVFRYRHVNMMLWVSLVLIIVFGGATLVLHDDRFIKWKTTLLYWVFSLAILFSQFILRKNLIQKALNAHIQLPPLIWVKLNVIWGLFFAALGIANLWVAYRFSNNTWVDFKLFGTTGATLMFIVIQSLWLARYKKEG
ncbi:septation protein A [Candidatus Vallotia tarda]|uniref:Inner membrane-spanning protein YciB n=1 Tax=Candidatus Vallotiella hemipterorum TaxID=1177213 RepID=A0A916NFL4_9BURK|nr:septation protein A [Candidatus Vallotia tarda]CAG7601964.1 Probable intracellular septation protein A [Candidatus Vallotia tarda]